MALTFDSGTRAGFVRTRQAIRVSGILALPFILAVVTTPAHAAQTFPTRPVRMLVAATPGAGPDIVARLIGAKMAEEWGQQVVVDNRAGASGMIAAEILANAPGDGHTLWLATMSHMITTILHQRLLLAKEFAPVSLVATTPFVIVSSASVPVKSIGELIEFAKARPGKMLYGSAGVGSSGHLCMEIFRRMAGIDIVHVPYKSIPITLTDLMTGQIQASCGSIPSVTAVVKGGKVRALAVTSPARSRLAPGVPSVAEGMPGYELQGWYGLLAPRGTPPHIIARINAAAVAAVKNREVDERLLANGAEAVGSTAADFGAFLQKETPRWQKVLPEAGVRPE